MKKEVFIFLSLLSFLSCQSNLKVLSAKRKTIYPDITTQKPYVKFIIKIEASKEIIIDSATIVDNNKCFKLNRIHTIVEKSRIQKKHTIELVFKGNENITNSCLLSKNGLLTLFYTASNYPKKLEISSFTHQKETRR